MADVVDLLPWDIAIKSATEKRSAKALLSRDDADQVIAEMTPLEAYYAVKSLGVEGSTPLLQVLRPEQVRTLFDLEVWHRGALAVDDVLVWLGALREASMERLVAAAHTLDPELMALVFRRRLLIARKVRDDNGDLVPDWVVEPPDEILPLVETPDGRFIVAARPHDELDLLEADDDLSGVPLLDEEDRKSVIEVLMDLYKHDDFEHVAGLLRLAETDLTSDVEETALRFRDARLEDLGFPSRERAMAVYALGDADALAAPAGELPGETEGVRLPALFAQPAAQGLFHAAMRAIEDPMIVRRIEGELVTLANAVLVADGIEPGELERIAEVLTRVRGTLELAISHRVSGSLVDEARARLERWSLRTLFSAGYALTVRQASRARALAKGGALDVAGRSLGLLDERDRAVLVALTRGRRPLYAPAAGEPRGFGTHEELGEVRARLDELEVWLPLAASLRLGAVSEALEGEIEPPDAAERTLGLWIGTLAAQALLGLPLAATPLAASGLARLGAVLAEEGLAASTTRAAGVVAALAGRAADDPAVVERVRRALSEIADALLPALHAGGTLDPRFVGGLVRARR
jgi:hypothetical protein